MCSVHIVVCQIEYPLYGIRTHDVPGCHSNETPSNYSARELSPSGTWIIHHHISTTKDWILLTHLVLCIGEPFNQYVFEFTTQYIQVVIFAYFLIAQMYFVIRGFTFWYSNRVLRCIRFLCWMRPHLDYILSLIPRPRHVWAMCFLGFCLFEFEGRKTHYDAKLTPRFAHSVSALVWDLGRLSFTTSSGYWSCCAEAEMDLDPWPLS